MTCKRSLVRVQLSPPKNSTSFDLSNFLFKPQAWYGITRKRVWYRRRRMASPKVHFLRLDSIPSCNGFHTMLCIDSIHASGVIVTHRFKSIRKLPEISFLCAFLFNSPLSASPLGVIILFSDGVSCIIAFPLLSYTKSKTKIYIAFTRGKLFFNLYML